MFRIDGLDELEQQLSVTQTALEALDGELGAVEFDPKDPASIESAIADMEARIDSRLASHQINPLVASFVESMKAQYREAILEKAAATRMDESLERE